MSSWGDFHGLEKFRNVKKFYELVLIKVVRHFYWGRIAAIDKRNEFSPFQIGRN